MKKTMDLCVFESEEYEHGLGAGVNTTLLCAILTEVKKKITHPDCDSTVIFMYIVSVN